MKKPIKPLAELLDSVRDIEGFPIGKDEDILALSNPPYYTACPNPYIKDFIEEYGKPYDEETDDYFREPLVVDVSEGKNDPIYMAHQYPTKVPYKAIKNYLKHYTEEGDIIFDGFCGTGMTGVAAQFLKRNIILSDLSPFATFIACNFNSKVNYEIFKKEITYIQNEMEEELGWMYETNHNGESSGNNTKGKINFIVWSDVFICSHCNKEHVYWENALDRQNKKLNEYYQCPNCKAKLHKKYCKKASSFIPDPLTNSDIIRTKQVPVLINYTYKNKRFEKKPDNHDIAIINKINECDIPYWIPINKIMNKGKEWGDTWRAGVHYGITHVHHFYTKRNLWALSSFFDKAFKSDIYGIRFLFSSMISRSTQLNRVSIRNYFYGGGGWNLSPLAGTLYFPSLSIETSILEQIQSRIKLIGRAFKSAKYSNATQFIISTESTTNSSVLNNSVDYIFTDPPFGENLMYSELNFISESWLKVFTNNKCEAIINKSQNKALFEYQELMFNSFKGYYRVLKPNRWMTVVFHNSRSTVWNAIQDSITKAGFIVANVAVLDKKQGSFKQVTAAGAVKNDLVISAYKPKSSFTRQFLEMAGEGLEEEFIRTHLSHLKSEPSIERTEQMLYSKMLAYYVQRSYTVKYDASSFYKMLRNKFVEEDGYWFNPDQLDAYNEVKRKMKLDGIDEISKGMTTLFVSDEKSALIWLHAFLDKPKDFQEIHPAFHKVASISGDRVPELSELLNDNFVKEGDNYRRPQNEEEKMSVAQRRERELMREFETLLLDAKASKRKIKDVRKQALVHGFEKCYKSNRFQDILTVAKRLDRSILENNADITEFIEVAEMKVEGF